MNIGPQNEEYSSHSERNDSSKDRALSMHCLSGGDVSLSRLNHWLPRREAHLEISRWREIRIGDNSQGHCQVNEIADRPLPREHT